MNNEMGRGPGGAMGESPIRTAGGSPGGVRAMPPGGMIGGGPGTGSGQSGAGARRVNPVGGMIGENEPAGRPGSRGAALGGPVFGQPGGRTERRDEHSNARSWNADNPWETEEGVAPVVLPPREQRIDPGPAIGLS